MSQQEYTVHVDVLPDEVGAPAEGLTPEENVAAWKQEIQELGSLLPVESSARIGVETLAYSAESWETSAQYTAQREAADLSTEVPKQYNRYRQAALNANTPYSQDVAIGASRAPLSHEYPTEGMVDATLNTHVPRNMFDGMFGPYAQTGRQATVHRAHQETADTVTRRYQGGVNTYFDKLQPAVEAAAQADPDQASQQIYERLVTYTDQKLSSVLDTLRGAIMDRREMGLGSIAMTDRFRADSAVADATMQARQALFVPSRFTPEFNTLVSDFLQKSYGLPSEQAIADRIAGAVDRARSTMTDRLHKQVQHMVVQHRNGVQWPNMSVAPLEYQVPQQSSEKPKYKTEVDAEITRLRAEGLTDVKIRRRLIMKYHSDTEGGSDPDKARYVSSMFAAAKPKQGPRDN